MSTPPKALVRLAASVFAALALIAPTAKAQPTADHWVVPPTDAHYASLSVKWWQWAFSLPVSRNPLVDPTGRFAGLNQPGDHFFIGGLFSLNAGLDATATRTIAVPRGKYLFFPILNNETDGLGAPPPPPTLVELRKAAAAFADSVVDMYATIDGKPVTDLLGYRTISPVFAYTLPKTNGTTEQNLAQYFGVNVTGRVYPAVGDGYYLLLKPLPPGWHTITFGGSTTTTDGQGNPALFKLNITYHINVLK